MIVDLHKKLADEIRIYSQRRVTQLTIEELYSFGAKGTDDQRIVHAAKFLHTELPIRLARMARCLESLPYGLADVPNVQRIQDLYIQSFRDVTSFAHPRSVEDDKKFAHLLDAIKRRHTHVLPMMAGGISELKDRLGVDLLGPEVQEYLDTFNLSRIGIRMIIGQYLALHAPRAGWSGILHSETCPAAVAEEAIENAMGLSRMTYGVAPKIEIAGKRDLTFTYIPTHLNHMLFELLKNSLRATVETHGVNNPLPPVKIVIADGAEDITIKIEDEGGGIPRSGIGRIFSYQYTTAPQLPNDSYASREMDRMAGYGYGLPITRLYARYFGGDLQVISMEGYGTDAYLHLSRLGHHQELLPA
jgi:pyruvate dehydrogenase kinase 2/3/4